MTSRCLLHSGFANGQTWEQTRGPISLDSDGGQGSGLGQGRFGDDGRDGGTRGYGKCSAYIIPKMVRSVKVALPHHCRKTRRFDICHLISRTMCFEIISTAVLVLGIYLNGISLVIMSWASVQYVLSERSILAVHQKR